MACDEDGKHIIEYDRRPGEALRQTIPEQVGLQVGVALAALAMREISRAGTRTRGGGQKKEEHGPLRKVQKKKDGPVSSDPESSIICMVCSSGRCNHPENVDCVAGEGKVPMVNRRQSLVMFRCQAGSCSNAVHAACGGYHTRAAYQAAVAPDVRVPWFCSQVCKDMAQEGAKNQKK